MRIKQLKRHVFKLFIIVVISNIMIFLLGQIITLHPNAYFDLARSIVIVYLFFVVIISSAPILVSKMQRELKNTKFLQKNNIKEKFDSPIIWISLCFSLLTVTNSIMMIFGLDTPKQGLFAYVHILLRLTIIIISVSLFMISEWRGMITKKNVFESLKKQFVKSINVQYASIVAVYCVMNIVFSPLFYFPSGYFLYKTLVGIYVLLGIVSVIKFKMI